MLNSIPSNVQILDLQLFTRLHTALHDWTRIMVSTNARFFTFLFLRFIDYYGKRNNDKELKLSPCNRSWGSRGRVEVQPYSFIKLGVKWRWVVNATRRPLYLRGRNRYPLYRRLVGPQGRYGRMRKISSQLGIDTWTFQPLGYRNVAFSK
jgi:hypothetical protein